MSQDPIFPEGKNLIPSKATDVSLDRGKCYTWSVKPVIFSASADELVVADPIDRGSKYVFQPTIP